MKIDIKHIAKLANLTLTDEETKRFEGQLEETLKYIEQLKEIPTENIKETNQVTNLKNVTREDTAKPSLTEEEALSNAANKHSGFFRVKAIIEE